MGRPQNTIPLNLSSRDLFFFSLPPASHLHWTSNRPLFLDRQNLLSWRYWLPASRLFFFLFPQTTECHCMVFACTSWTTKRNGASAGCFLLCGSRFGSVRLLGFSSFSLCCLL